MQRPAPWDGRTWIEPSLDAQPNEGYLLRLLRGCNSVVECDLPKVEVEGSTPFTRSVIV